MSEIDWDAVLKIADRREHLCRHAPVCPACSTRQVQLTHWFDDIAHWKCRKCNTRFKFEPPKQTIQDK